MAEREGFEPSIRFKTYTPLAGERLQPLGHLSDTTAKAAWASRYRIVSKTLIDQWNARVGCICYSDLPRLQWEKPTQNWRARKDSNLRPPGS